MAMTTQRQSQDEINAIYEAEYQRRGERIQRGGSMLLAFALSVWFVAFGALFSYRLGVFGDPNAKLGGGSVMSRF
jgi:hypothetical protein